MKVYEKIKQLYKDKGWNLTNLHEQIVALFKEDATSYRTLHRTVHGETSLRESTLFQIASALGTSPDELRKNTDEEPKFTYFTYNKKAYLEFEATELNFLVGKLVLLPTAKTETEQDPSEHGNFVKWLHGLQGEMTVVITTPEGQKKQVIKKGEDFYFHSTNPHYFENHTSKKATCLLIQNPKYI